MTDEAKALVERSSETIRSQMYLDLVANDTQHKEMLALIETQAREIERLRGVLKRWQYSGCPDCSGDCGSANPPVMCCIMEETRAALAGDSYV